jgi:hypothetical protein
MTAIDQNRPEPLLDRPHPWTKTCTKGQHRSWSIPPTRPPLCALCPHLAYVKRKIAERVTNASHAHVHAIFAEAAFLAGRAIEVATELQRLPGMSAEAFAETLDFWRHVRDHANTAALDSLGENATLAEVLVTFRLLHQQPGSRRAT